MFRQARWTGGQWHTSTTRPRLQFNVGRVLQVPVQRLRGSKDGAVHSPLSCLQLDARKLFLALDAALLEGPGHHNVDSAEFPVLHDVMPRGAPRAVQVAVGGPLHVVGFDDPSRTEVFPEILWVLDPGRPAPRGHAVAVQLVYIFTRQHSLPVHSVDPPYVVLVLPRGNAERLNEGLRVCQAPVHPKDVRRPFFPEAVTLATATTLACFMYSLT